ncbi:hypothetical protein B5X24_HaOG217248 [Helicoverpa armigera]|uniref:Uncharacterized protein n=1 Tax=Helicoverpa armigera TaxID=29058 RepID=A0A2W1BUG5_HELAM|nr:hypothetical protein B5X24_HaOG217248 [Helicoverpa armigera]
MNLCMQVANPYIFVFMIRGQHEVVSKKFGQGSVPSIAGSDGVTLDATLSDAAPICHTVNDFVSNQCELPLPI